MKNLWIILPVKDFAKSKLRLAKMLSDADRICLAQAMFIDVLNTLKLSAEVNTIVVITASEQVKKLAQDSGVEVLLEPESCQDLNQAVHLGVDYAQASGAEQALILHADLPLLKTQHLTILQDAHGLHEVSLLPDKHKQGSNVMMLTLPSTMQFFYGEGSFHLHQLFCKQQTINYQTIIIEDLMLDIDEPEDVIELYSRLPKASTSATKRCLSTLDQSILLTKKSMV